MRLLDSDSVLFICIAAVLITFIISVTQCEREKMYLQSSQQTEGDHGR